MYYPVQNDVPPVHVVIEGWYRIFVCLLQFSLSVKTYILLSADKLNHRSLYYII